MNDANRRAITRKASNGFDWGMGVWKKLRVERDVATGLMTVEDVAAGTVILSATDRTFADGFIGFGSIGDPGRVRNLRLWAPSSGPGPAGFFQPKN